MLDAAHEMEHMAQAEARKRRTEIEEFEHQKAYQQCRNRLNYLRGQIRSLGIQESLVRHLDQTAALRAERRTLETTQADLTAELATLDEARKAASVALLLAQHACNDLATEATTALRTMRAALREARDALSAKESLDYEEQAAAAQQALAAIIGTDEAQALADDPQGRPAWMRG